MAKFKIGDRVRRNPDKINYAGWNLGSGEVTVTDAMAFSIKTSGVDLWWHDENFTLVSSTLDNGENFYVSLPGPYPASSHVREIHGPMSLEDARKRAQAIPIGSKARIFSGVEEITATRSFETKVLN